MTTDQFFSFTGVLILSALANNYRLHKLKVVDQFVMMYGGLRGAVAFALVLLIDPKVKYDYIFTTKLFMLQNSTLCIKTQSFGSFFVEKIVKFYVA